MQGTEFEVMYWEPLPYQLRQRLEQMVDLYIRARGSALFAGIQFRFLDT
jgi:hypothetical protein